MYRMQISNNKSLTQYTNINAVQAVSYTGSNKLVSMFNLFTKKRNVFKFFLKAERDVELDRESGRLFHMVGELKLNVRSPYDVNFTLGTLSRFLFPERRFLAGI